METWIDDDVIPSRSEAGDDEGAFDMDASGGGTVSLLKFASLACHHM